MKVRTLPKANMIFDSKRQKNFITGEIFECDEERFNQLTKSEYGCLVEKVEEAKKEQKIETAKRQPKKETATKKVVKTKKE
jgi:hypothetical protein